MVQLDDISHKYMDFRQMSSNLKKQKNSVGWHFGKKTPLDDISHKYMDFRQMSSNFKNKKNRLDDISAAMTQLHVHFISMTQFLVHFTLNPKEYLKYVNEHLKYVNEHLKPVFEILIYTFFIM